MLLDSSLSQGSAQPDTLTNGSRSERYKELDFRPISSVLAIAPRVSVVIPALNEAENLPHVFGTLPAWIHEVVLVDGHSTDNTVQVAKELRSDVKIVTQNGKGKGDALCAGFSACTGDIIVMIDADGSTDGNEIIRFVGALAAGADFAKGSRFSNGGCTDDMTRFRKYGNRALNVLVNRTFGTRLTDLCYGYNAFWARHLDAVMPDCDGFEVETLMTIRAARAGLRIQEIPSYERNRIHGASNLHSIRDGFRILRVIARERLARQRPRPPVAPTTVPVFTGSLHPASAAVRLDTAASASAEPDASVAVSAPRPTVDMSVAICAYTEQRWDDTLTAVSSVTAQRPAPYEVIVVVDHNRELYRRLRAALPDVVVVENRDRRGLSGGKNTAVQVARGDVVAFLDDDAIAEADWLAALAEPYRNESVLGVGGLTRPLWADGRPAWFPEEFDWVIGCTYVGMSSGAAAGGVPVRNLLGGNASFRRAAFDLAGGFRTDIGRSWSRRPLGCEETEFCIRLRQRLPDATLLFNDRAVIWHRVSEARSRFGYFLSRCHAEGMSKAMVTDSVGLRHGLSTEVRYTSRTLPAGVARGMSALLRGDRSGALRAGAILAGVSAAGSGYAAGALRNWLVRLRLAQITSPAPPVAGELDADDTRGTFGEER